MSSFSTVLNFYFRASSHILWWRQACVRTWNTVKVQVQLIINSLHTRWQLYSPNSAVNVRLLSVSGVSVPRDERVTYSFLHLPSIGSNYIRHKFFCLFVFSFVTIKRSPPLLIVKWKLLGRVKKKLCGRKGEKKIMWSHETFKCSKSKMCKPRKLKLHQPVYLIRWTGWWSSAS